MERGRAENWGRKLARPRAEAGQTTKLLICLSEPGGEEEEKKKFRETELRSGNIVPIIQRDASASILPSSRNEKNVFFLEFFPLLLLLLLLLRFSNLKFNRSRHP